MIPPRPPDVPESQDATRTESENAAPPEGEAPANKPPPPATRLPSIPGYDVEGILGSGGMGTVYRARHHKLNRPVALKMLRGGSHASTDDIRRFRSEAEAVARLQHPNIVQLYEGGEHDGQPFFALELVDGGDLKQKAPGPALAPQGSGTAGGNAGPGNASGAQP